MEVNETLVKAAFWHQRKSPARVVEAEPGLPVHNEDRDDDNDPGGGHHHGGVQGGGEVQDCAKLPRDHGEGGLGDNAWLQVKPALVFLLVAATCGGEGVQLARGRGGQEGLQARQGGAGGWRRRLLLQPQHPQGHPG